MPLTEVYVVLTSVLLVEATVLANGFVLVAELADVLDANAADVTNAEGNMLVVSVSVEDKRLLVMDASG